MKAEDYFKNDIYWNKHINKELEEDFWIDEYKAYFKSNGKCLDLGCGIGQYSKKLMGYGYDVVSADISDIALNKVRDFNKNVVKLDMRNDLPFQNSEFDIVFANLSIHYFSDADTKKLLLEIKRILKENGLFIGSVNGIQGLKVIKDEAKEIEYLSIFKVLKIDEKEIKRFNHKKNYITFIAEKN